MCSVCVCVWTSVTCAVGNWRVSEANGKGEERK